MFINISFCWPPAHDWQNHKSYSTSWTRSTITAILYSLSWIFCVPCNLQEIYFRWSLETWKIFWNPFAIGFVNIKEGSDSRGNNPAFDEKKQLYVPKESGNFLFVELNCLFWLCRTIKEVICKVSLGMAISPGSLQEMTAFSCPLFPIFFAFLHSSAWMFLRPGISHRETISIPVCLL